MDKRWGILIVIVTILVLSMVGTASATNWSVDGSGGADFTGIQDAINNASDGDTILVYSGIYYENVVVDKSVTLKGIDQPVVDAGGRKSAITLTSDGITLVGFNATNSGSSWGDVGIEVTLNNNTITGNNVCNNSGSGISLAYSNNNTITCNNISNNKYCGIVFDGSNNTITGNTFVNDGLLVIEAYQNTVEDNIVNGKPLVYLEDASDYKVEDAGQVIIVNCNNITIENLDLSNTSYGIALWKTENSKISNNNVCNNRGGIRLYYSSNNTITGNNVRNNGGGISLSSSSNNTITGNNASNNGDGISLSSSSSNNTITGNNVSNNNEEGISLYTSSNNNTITGNVFVNQGLSVFSSYQNTVNDNKVNGKPLVYLEDVSDYKVENAGQVILINCSNISVENLDLSNASIGVELLKTRNSSISNNTACNNWNGIHLYDSSNNSITGNNACNNRYGIYLGHSSNNKIYFNNFINNIYNLHSSKSTNIWNSPLEITYTYEGTTYKSYLGNYRDDYEGTDTDANGIGDTHYSIYTYPLMKPFENYILPRSAPT